MRLAQLMVLCALTLTTGPALGQTGSFRASPVTEANVAEVQLLIQIADALDAAVDAKDWRMARSFFAEEITVDFSDLTGQPEATIPADDLIAGWSSNLNARKTSFHLRGNHRIRFGNQNDAMMHSHGYAWNRLEEGALPENGGDPLWEVWGTYEHGFAKVDGRWEITSMRFTPTAQRGNFFVRDTVIEP